MLLPRLILLKIWVLVYFPVIYFFKSTTRQNDLMPLMPKYGVMFVLIYCRADGSPPEWY